MAAVKRVLFTAVLLLASCAPKPSVVVVPADREVRALPGEPGYFRISAGHLQELYEDNLLLTHELEQCRAGRTD